jgi:hypothetical protein
MATIGLLAWKKALRTLENEDRSATAPLADAGAIS